MPYFFIRQTKEIFATPPEAKPGKNHSYNHPFSMPVFSVVL